MEAYWTAEPERRERPEKALGALRVVGAPRAGRAAKRVARMVVVYILWLGLWLKCSEVEVGALMSGCENVL